MREFLLAFDGLEKQPIVYVIIFLVLLSFIYQAKRPAIRGAFGEWLVNRRLRKLGDEYHIFSDLYIPDDNGGYTQVDHLIVSVYGIVVLETKNYSGWIFGSETQKYWTQVIYKNKNRFYNPIRQNYGHIQSLKHHLNKVNLPAESVIVFTGDAVLKMEQPFETSEVLTLGALRKYLLKERPRLLAEDEVGNICRNLKSLASLDAAERKRVKKLHLRGVKQKQKESVLSKRKVGETVIPVVEESPEALSQDSCPRCNHPLILRKGKYGDFIGCSAFPKCRYTMNKQA
ncbi:nuclease-related domain-containing protein [Sporosarcina trichiuri]|uniref:nuclease-related domain-containing protein n=1 Tax=Sporosarcina trichiuri TaxID=3056445 RepID=UPI0025B32DDC|nr:NERD domain-containing protein [Sporosarcina sp. 0.2-SM1T-5]WJY28116.1 NERD domain-containing protein [Sporosarcina sp. 0.2-SM1T-5]